MGDVHRECEGPLAGWIGPFASWLVSSGCAPGRVRRAVLAFGRLSSWLAERDVGLADLDEDVIDEYVLAEQARSGSKFPAALQYLPLAKRFLASHELVVLRGPSRRDRAGGPPLPAGPLAGGVVVPGSFTPSRKPRHSSRTRPEATAMAPRGSSGGR